MENLSTQDEAKVKAEHTKWTPIMETTLLGLLKEQVLICNKAENGFTRAQWTQIENKFKEKLGIPLDKSSFKNKLTGWRNTYRIAKELQTQSGFGWGDAKHMVVVDELVWTEYLKKNKDAKRFYKKPLRYWQDLCIVIGNDMAEGGNQVDFSDVQHDNWCENEFLEVSTEDLHDDNDPDFVIENHSEMDEPITSKVTKCPIKHSVHLIK